MKTQETLAQWGLRRAFGGSRIERTGRLGAATVCLVVLLLSSAGRAGTYSGGAGTDVDPYQISTTADWQTLVTTPGDWDKHFVLTADLDFVWADLAPVAGDGNRYAEGFQGTPFTGIFDGGGHWIRRFYLDDPIGVAMGLFGCLDVGGRIVNLNIEDATIVGDQQVGGLVGLVNYGTIANCTVYASVTGNLDVGGLVGESIVGQIVNCSCGCVVNGSGDVGGLLGQNVIGIIMGCQTIGAVTGQSGTGGLIGWNDFGVTLNCCSRAVVSGSDIVGGLIGADQGYIGNSYNAGVVRGKTYVGGLVGVSNGAVVASFWDTDASGQALSDGGTGTTTALMQSSKTFTDAGWDLVGETANGLCDFWQMPASAQYPIPALFYDYVPAKLDGDGTIRTPFQIKSAAELATIWRRPAACYQLTADLDVAGLKWSSGVIPMLIGRLDGQGHWVKNVTIASNGGFMGFIGCVAKEAVVSNLGVEDVNVAGRIKGGAVVYQQGDSFVGALAGFNLGLISACYSLGAVTGDTAVGGLVGYSCDTGNITDCYSRATAQGHEGVGGLIGWNSGLVSHCYSTGYVQGELVVGGLIGGLPTCGTGSPFHAAVVGSLWDMETSQTDISGGGYGMTTAQMRDINTFLSFGWDFVDEKTNGLMDAWTMPAWKSYPLLAWQKVTQTPLTVDGFESGTFTALPWRTGGDAPWVIAMLDRYSGQASARSGPVSLNQTSTLEFTAQFGYGDVSFALMVSSEEFYDKLAFSIDGVEQASWSGNVHWMKATIPIPPGRHTLTWTYNCDESDIGGRNAAWIDEVSVPIL